MPSYLQSSLPTIQSSLATPFIADTSSPSLLGEATPTSSWLRTLLDQNSTLRRALLWERGLAITRRSKVLQLRSEIATLKASQARYSSTARPTSSSTPFIDDLISLFDPIIVGQSTHPESRNTPLPPKTSTETSIENTYVDPTLTPRYEAPLPPETADRPKKDLRHRQELILIQQLKFDLASSHRQCENLKSRVVQLEEQLRGETNNIAENDEMDLDQDGVKPEIPTSVGEGLSSRHIGLVGRGALPPQHFDSRGSIYKGLKQNLRSETREDTDQLKIERGTYERGSRAVERSSRGV